MNLWIAIPTYWTFPTTEKGEEQTIFDHPTPLDEEGTLARTLESFQNLKGKFKVLIVAAAANPVLGRRVHARIAQLLKPFSNKLELYLASPANLDAMNRLLPGAPLKLDSYGNIRNVQLAVPYAMGADAVVGIDDDEVLKDPDFLSKAARVGTTCDGVTVGGMAGPYFDATGEYRLKGAEALGDCPNIFLKKNYYMNEALKKFMTAPLQNGLVKSNVAFGGNMVMSRATIARACHDPYIPRGEDYDYVINAAFEGILFFFQPGMGITHLPPDSTGSQAADKLSKLLADIKRFIYMRRKDDHHRANFPQEKIDLNYLLPYPGCYLDEKIDLREHAVRAIKDGYPDHAREHSAEAFVAEAIRLADEKAREFFAYRPVWQRALKALNDNAAFREIVAQSRM